MDLIDYRMKKNKLILCVILIVETSLIAFLAFKLNHTQKLLKIDENLITNMIRSSLVSDTAVLNAFDVKLRKGDTAFVKQLIESRISTNVLFLQEKTYGELTLDESNAINIVLKNMANWQSNKTN
jgi:hypothetical protein